MDKYVNFNGNLFPDGAKILDLSNRAFRYGDGLFETMFATNKQIPLAHKHFERLRKGMEFLYLDIPYNFTEKFFLDNCTKLLIENNHSKGAKVRFQVYRNGSGKYLPNDNSFSFTVESSPLEYDRFQLNKDKFLLDIFTEIKKPINSISTYKTNNSMLYILASLWAKRKNLVDCLITNELGNICEATSSNLFVVVGDHLTTPSLENGCVDGIMRKYIIQLARVNGFIVDEARQLNEDLLLGADEIFLTNAVSGIKWVLGFKKRRYYSKQALKLTELLNESLGI